MEPPEQVRVAGDWIVYVTNTLLPYLADRRRRLVAEIVEEEDWDTQRLAETIGSRRQVMDRLAKEGRRARGTSTGTRHSP